MAELLGVTPAHAVRGDPVGRFPVHDRCLRSENVAERGRRSISAIMLCAS
jgi:hypothetical protein